MAKAELKTRKNRKSVTAFLSGIEDEQRRKDAKAVHKIMREVNINKLEDIDPEILRDLVSKSVAHMKKKHPN